MHAPDKRENVLNIDNEVIQFTITHLTYPDILLTEIKGKSISFKAFKKKKMKKKSILNLEQNLTERNH